MPLDDAKGRGGLSLPRLGLGTWYMGERPERRAAELEALRTGLDLGIRMIDTAEMYGSGKSEALVGEAIRGRRDGLVLVSKVLPHNASRRGTAEACERSLRHLATECIDLYLLHWQGPHPLEETFDSFKRLKRDGKIRHWGVSNFDADDLADAVAEAGGEALSCDQVMYGLARRGIERRLVPWCERHEVAVMAYSPLDHGRLPEKPALAEVAARHGVAKATVAVAWSMRHPGVATIPKAARADHVREIAAAAELRLTDEDLSALDRAYPPPARDVPLDIL